MLDLPTTYSSGGLEIPLPVGDDGRPLMYGPHDDIFRTGYKYRVFYHPYLGKYLGYRLKLPDNFNPDTKYAVMIWGGASGVTKYTYASYVNDPHMTYDNMYPATWFTDGFSEMIYLIPQKINWDEWLNEAQTTTDHPEYFLQGDGKTLWGAWGKALKELLLNLIDEKEIPYKTAYCDESEVWEENDNPSSDNPSDNMFNFPKIDENKIYIGGYSGGAFCAFDVLTDLRDIVSGVWSTAGQPYGNAYDNHWGESSSYYNDFIINRMNLLAEYWCHIPMFLSVCTYEDFDPVDGTGMNFACEAFVDSIANACTKHGKTNKFYLRTINYKDYLLDTWSSGKYNKDSKHSYYYEMSPCMTTSNYIDFSSHEAQSFKAATLYVSPYYVLGTDGITYKCKKQHTSSDSNKPITGIDYSEYWTATAYDVGETWVTGISYPPYPVIGTDGKDYICKSAHTSSSSDKPITGASYSTYWLATSGIGHGETWVSGKFYPSTCPATKQSNTAIYPGTTTFTGSEYISPITAYSPSSPGLNPYTDPTPNSNYIAPMTFLRNYWTKDQLEDPVDLDTTILEGDLDNLPYNLIHSTGISGTISTEIDFNNITLTLPQKRNTYSLIKTPIYFLYQTGNILSLPLSSDHFYYIYYLVEENNTLRIYSTLFGDVLIINKSSDIIDYSGFRLRYVKNNILELWTPKQYTFFISG